MRRRRLVLSVVLLLPGVALAQPLFSPTQDPLEKSPWPMFSGAEMADLVAYLRSLKRAK